MKLYRILPALVLLTPLLGGCASTALTAGAGLAKAGQAAATQMEQNATLTAAQYTALKEAVVFGDGFAGLPDNPASKSFLAHESSIQSKLAVYGQWLESLSSAYAALGDLAGYDAAGSFAMASGALCGSTSDLIKTLSADAAVPAAACPTVQTAGGWVLGAVQAGEVTDESDKIEAILKTMVPILSDPNTRSLIILNNQLVQDQISGTAQNLYATGVYSCAPLLNDLGTPLGLKTVDDVDSVVAKNHNIRNGCLNYISVAVADNLDGIGKSYDKSVEGLNRLIKLHDSLKAGKPLDFDSINAILAGLQTFAAKLQPQKGK